MNIELLREVQAQLREEGNVDMHTWYRKHDLARGDLPSSCGTVGCIAGWAVILKEKEHITHPATLTSAGKVAEVGTKLLGINPEQGSRLFYVTHWPEEWRLRYKAAMIGCERAKVVHDYIDYFIEQELSRMRVEDGKVDPDPSTS